MGGGSDFKSVPAASMCQETLGLAIILFECPVIDLWRDGA